MLYRNDIMILQSLALLCLATAAPAQIASLCNTGQTSATSAGCSNTLEIPNAPGGGPDRDGNWQVAYPYPSALTSTHGPCALLQIRQGGWVDTPNTRWLANSVSSASQWIAPFDGENNLPAGPCPLSNPSLHSGSFARRPGAVRPDYQWPTSFRQRNRWDLSRESRAQRLVQQGNRPELSGEPHELIRLHAVVGFQLL